MTFEEKLAARGYNLDEMKAKLDAVVEARKQARRETRAEMAAELKELDAAFDAFDAAVGTKIKANLDVAETKAEEAKAALALDKATAEAVANEVTRIDEIQKGTAAQVARAKGDVAMAEENARLAHEYRDSRRNAMKLRAQMNVNNAKEKIAAKKEAKDKAEQEEWILDLFDYAIGCYEMSYSWALEAEYTLMEAAYELDYYNETFCKEE